MTPLTITPRELAERHARGDAVELIDVRTPAEFRELRCVFARNVPLGQLEEFLARRQPNGGAPLYVICQSGARGRQACQRLQQAGISVINIEGGTRAWAEAGLPVERGQSVMSLERQVRIAAGSLVLLGFALSFLHPWFIGLSAFVGAGLVFAGLTDTCGMGMLLARMPWNQTGDACGVPATKGASQ